MSSGLLSLLEVMQRLREPEKGCPWDLQQNHKSLARYTLEEAYEVVEAIEQGDDAHLREELGDLLLQIVFHAQIAQEDGRFTFSDVAQGEADKMIERHPHVFGQREAATAKDVLKNWEADKAEKREAAAKARGHNPSVLDDVNTALPAISRALKLQQRAARVGFDWTAPEEILEKVREEVAELEAEIGQPDRRDAREDELGDVLFVVVNLARKLDIDPERALRRTNQKFERRFRSIETALAAQGRAVKEASLEEKEELWQAAKQAEKAKAQPQK